MTIVDCHKILEIKDVRTFFKRTLITPYFTILLIFLYGIVLSKTVSVRSSNLATY